MNEKTEREAPAGWKLVPVEPTLEMIDAAGESIYGHPKEKAIEWAKADKFDSCAESGVRAYRAMLAAAPLPPVSDPAEQPNAAGIVAANGKAGEREAFEAWAKHELPMLPLNWQPWLKGYANEQADWLWTVWQARALLAKGEKKC